MPRFGAVEISGETLHCVNKLIANDVAYSTAFQGDCKGEMQVAPILDRMLRNLGRFTRPRELEKEPPSSPSDKKADFVLQYEADKKDTNAGVENLYQPAMFAIQELLETAAHPKSYRPPVTIMAGDKDDWYYGILEIDGFVWVENHQIDPANDKHLRNVGVFRFSNF
ncbi:hypothetical protein SELMODRAFT_407844 [Selaginella moellendorffii]|uniref:Uncharacterized protein n=1 Tax=Selaginella moellendorffii TaxID=88036 RepID=D8R4Y3_SELML|nr:hypothetical protein SELMODRAFT_407844 [Selaginella moellendorffii]